MKFALGLASATLLALAAPSQGAEVLGGFVDMRLGLGTTDGSYDVSVNANAAPGVTSGSTSESFGQPLLFSLDWIGSLGLRSYGGWLWGIGGTEYYSTGGKAGGETIKAFNAWCIRGHFGYGIPFTDTFQLEALPFVGFGRIQVELPGGNDLSQAQGSNTEIGIDFNGVFTLANGFQFGVTAGYEHWGNGGAFTNEVTGATYKFSGDNFIIGGFIGVRL